MIRQHIGDCRQVLRTMPDESVHCVVTSPPYFGLRDYGIASQIGLEATPDAYVAEMVAVFREVRRMLRKDGTLWLNLGDSYHNVRVSTSGQSVHAGELRDKINGGNRHRQSGLKSKDLIGIPWRVAFALQADGWYLRQDIIWAKKNCMPESVTDRCTKAHEYLFLLSKTPKYYYDAVSISEESKDPEDDARRMRQSWEKKEKHRETSISSFYSQSDEPRVPSGKRNKRSVWEVATQPFSEAHFATFPPALIEPCILAGCPKDGTVLDPFAGAGTTGLVADRLQRNAILIELNPTYAGMSARRITDDGPLFAKVVMADDDAGAEKVGNGPAAPAAEDFDPTADFVGSLLEAYGEIRERMAAGGPGWTPKEPSND